MNAKKGFNFGKILPYIVAVAIFAVITIVYFYPVFEGKKLYGGDIVQFKAMAKEITDYRNKTGNEPLWTNNMFSGMPAYQISMEYDKNLMTYIHAFIRMGNYLPIGMVLLYFLGFYFLLQVLGLNKWLSIAGAIGFAFSSYFFVILVAGHTSKAFAIGYMAPVIAGVILTYRGKYLAGGLITTFFLALEIVSGHPQITYYLMIMILVYGFMELIKHFREKNLAPFFKASAVLIGAAILAILTHSASLWNTYEYSKYSIRGKTELSTEKENRTSGLDKDYAVDWSYGVDETMTLLIPGFFGGSSNSSLSKNSETYKALIENKVPKADAERFLKGFPLYWGEQKFTSGPVYAGAIILFLFVFSLFYLKGPLKWWGITVTVLSILLSWGKHFMPLTNFFMEYVPLYNKFRAVSMTLVIAEFSIPLLGFIALDQLLKDGKKEVIFKYLKLSLYIVGGILLLFIALAGSLYSFSGPGDAALGLPDWVWAAVRADRLSMFRTDAIRSLIFVLLAFGLLWFYLKGKLKLSYVLIILPVLILIDMWPVNKRFISNDDFARKNQVETPYQASKADLEILKDKDPNYRVYNFNEAFDQSARTSYFHKNIGGYHGAKLRRYQELIDVPLINERRMIIESINDKKIPLEQALQRSAAFNMLNTRYFIINESSQPLQNPFACGNAWFVRDYKFVNNADEELAAIEGLNPDSTAIIDNRFGSFVSGFTVPNTPKGTIALTNYAPNYLVYEYSASQDEMAVFSEVYYDKGWKAFIDGKPAPHFRADFILRAMIVPAGDHKIEFKFEPRSFYKGQNVSLAASLLVILLTLGALGYYAYTKRLSDEGAK
jgi:hypothetical protein